jgi:hypothetical protein
MFQADPRLMRILAAVLGQGGGSVGGGVPSQRPPTVDTTSLLQHNFPGMQGQRFYGSGGPNNQFMFMDAVGQRPSGTQKGILTLLAALNNINSARTAFPGGMRGRGDNAGLGGLG